jgi:hypothetical protein
MQRISLVIVAVALLGACDKKDEGTPASGGETKAASAAPSGGGDAAKKDGGDAKKDAEAPKADGGAIAAKTDTQAAAAAPGSDEPFGVQACDDYVAKVSACATFDKKSKVFTMLTEGWRKAIAAGQSDAVAEKCAKAAEMFKCKDK